RAAPSRPRADREGYVSASAKARVSRRAGSPRGDADASLRSGPVRMLGLFSVMALGVNTIVGSGIFRLPAELARDLGPASIVAFVATALLLSPVALCFAEAGGMIAKD